MPTHFVTTKNIKFACGFCAPIAIILQKGVINAHKMALHVCNDTGSSCKVTDHVIQVHNVGTALVHSYPALTKCSQVSHLKSHKAKRLQANAVAVRQTCRSVTINSNLKKKLLVGIFPSKLRLNVNTTEQKFQLRRKNKYKNNIKKRKEVPTFVPTDISWTPLWR